MGEVAVALSSLTRLPRGAAGRLTSSPRRTCSAEQPLTVEPIIETAPLFSAKTTPPCCGCEERAG